MILFVIAAIIVTSQALPSFSPHDPVVAGSPDTESLVDAEEARPKRNTPIYCIAPPTLDGLSVVFTKVFLFTIALNLGLTDGRYLPVTPPTLGDLTYFRADSNFNYFVYSEDGRFHISTYDNSNSSETVVDLTSINITSVPEEAEFSVASLVRVTTLVFGHPDAPNATGV